VLRSEDFNQMLERRHKKNSNEIGIGIDDQAAIVVDGDQFKVLSTDGKAHVMKKRYTDDGTIQEIHYASNDDVFHPLSDLN
jgi:cyanophycinase-like exopeptidase